MTQLLGCLESYVENCRRHDRNPDFVVVDDSRDAGAEDRTRSALEQVRRRLGASIRYGGQRDKHRFAHALAAESGLPADVVGFALFGDERCSLFTGGNRNALLLDTAGSLVFSADDDTLCRIAAAPDLQMDAARVSEYDPTEFWFFPDRAAALDSIPSVDIDVLAPHEALLGTDVAITMHGLIGNSGMASPRYYFALTGASRERFVASEDAYRSALRSREILRTVHRPTIGAGTFCMTGFYGFDNRSLLPPFFPVQRNADGIFGLVLQKCFERRRTAFLPWALLHAPAESREFSLDDVWTDAESVRMADVVVDCVMGHATDARPLSDADRLSQLGAHLRQIGWLPRAEFEAHVRSLQQHRAVAFTALLSSRLHEHRASPAFWAADVEQLIGRTAKAPAGDDFVVPRDLRARHGADAARQLSQELVAQYGRLLEAWPSIVAAARRLGAKGERLTRPVRGAD